MSSRGRIFMTGATGFVGRHVMDWLCQSGYEVTALLRDGSSRPQGEAPSVRWVHPASMRVEFEAIRPTAVIHLATRYGPPNASVVEVVDANLRLPLELIELALECHCPVFLSTDTFFGKPGFKCQHLPLYVQSKSSFLALAASIEGIHERLRLVNMRLEHVYGPGDGPAKFTSHLIKALARGEPVALTEGRQERDFVYVSDVARAFEAVLTGFNNFPPGFSEVEVGVGEAVKLKAFVQLARDLSGSTSELNFGELPMRKDEIMRSVADNSILRRIGWSPKVTLAAGVKAMLAAETPLANQGNFPFQ